GDRDRGLVLPRPARGEPLAVPGGAGAGHLPAAPGVHRRHREHARAAGHPTRVGAPVGGARCLPGGCARRGGLGPGAGSAPTGGVLAHRARCADRAARPCAGHGTAGSGPMSALTDLAVGTSADDRVAAATDLITTAFHSLAVSKWLVADPDQR